jgi:hypothetical protein
MDACSWGGEEFIAAFSGTAPTESQTQLTVKGNTKSESDIMHNAGLSLLGYDLEQATMIGF